MRYAPIASGPTIPGSNNFSVIPARREAARLESVSPLEEIYRDFEMTGDIHSFARCGMTSVLNRLSERNASLSDIVPRKK